MQEEVQEAEDEWRDEEDEENGGLKVEEIRSSCDDHEMTRTSEIGALSLEPSDVVCNQV